jgi:hypothetical protein
MTGFEECIRAARTLLIYCLYAVLVPKKNHAAAFEMFVSKQPTIRTKIGHGNNDLLLSNKLPCQLSYSENIKELLHCILN